MVSLHEIRASNSRIPLTLPPGLVAVFVGATNGIGETTLKQFAKHTIRPRVYFIGRSQEAGDRIGAECKKLNAEGQFIFIKANTSLIKNVDDICLDIKKKENVIDLLFLTTGTLDFVTGESEKHPVPPPPSSPRNNHHRIRPPSQPIQSDRHPTPTETSEGLLLAPSLFHYSRTRFILNLLPLIQRSLSLRRVVSVFAGCKEGPIDLSDPQGRSMSLLAKKGKIGILGARGHAASLVTLGLIALERRAPDVAFLHEFPGPVKSGIGREGNGVMMGLMNVMFKVVGPFVNIAYLECGERHLFCATSARWPAGKMENAEKIGMVSLEGGVGVARGVTGEIGSGVYSVEWDGESAGPKIEELMAQVEKEGGVGKVWEDLEAEFKRITGVVSV